MTLALRTAALFALIALAASRAILLFHEFAGHGLAAIARGGEVTGHRLFLFGGGWIRYSKDTGFDTADQLVLSLGGIAVEIALAAIAVLAARRLESGRPLRIAAFGFAGICLIHVGSYLAAGTHHGFGDGLVLHRRLGELRALAVLPAAGLAIAAAYWLARRLMLEVPGLPAGRGRALAVLGVAALGAAAIHGGLYLVERQLTSDPTYAEVMRAEAERDARRALAAELARRRAAGTPMDAAEARRRERQLVAERQRFPIRPVLIALIAAAAVAGATRRRPPDDRRPLRLADLRGPALLCAAMLAAVAALARPFY